MIKRITDIRELSEYFPFITKLFEDKPEIFDADNVEECLADLISRFSNPRNFFFGQITNGTVDFFLSAIETKRGSFELLVDLCYSNPHQYKHTLDWIEICKSHTSIRGFKKYYWQTGRLTRAYRRFMSKLKAKPIKIIYELN